MKISVTTAVYKHRETIGSASEITILDQSYDNVELVVIDGVSTDGTLEVLYQYSNRIAVLVSALDNGIYDALNKGICNTSADVVGFFRLGK